MEKNHEPIIFKWLTIAMDILLFVAFIMSLGVFVMSIFASDTGGDFFNELIFWSMFTLPCVIGGAFGSSIFYLYQKSYSTAFMITMAPFINVLIFFLAQCGIKLTSGHF